MAENWEEKTKKDGELNRVEWRWRQKVNRAKWQWWSYAMLFGTRWWLWHIASVCKLLKALVTFCLTCLKALHSSVFNHAYYGLPVQGLLCTRLTMYMHAYTQFNVISPPPHFVLSTIQWYHIDLVKNCEKWRLKLIMKIDDIIMRGREVLYSLSAL